MSIFVSLLGLAFLILVHEAGHFFVARGVGMNPRKFYLGFPPAVVKTQAERDRVRRRSDPARRLREDSRHAPAGRRRYRRPLRPRDRGGTAARPAGRRSPAPPRRERLRGRRVSAGARSRRTSRRGGLAARPPLGRARSDGDSGLARTGRVLARTDVEAGRGHLRRAGREPRPCRRHLRRALHVVERQLPARVRAARHHRQRHRHGQRRARRLAGRGRRRPGGRPDPHHRRQAGRR